MTDPIRVLIVDDHAMVRKGLLAILKNILSSSWWARRVTGGRPSNTAGSSSPMSS